MKQNIVPKKMSPVNNFIKIFILTLIGCGGILLGFALFMGLGMGIGSSTTAKIPFISYIILYAAPLLTLVAVMFLIIGLAKVKLWSIIILSIATLYIAYDLFFSYWPKFNMVTVRMDIVPVIILIVFDIYFWWNRKYSR